MDEIKVNQPSVTYSLPSVTFQNYEYYVEQAQAVADYIGSLELTEDNVKDIKKDLARARKLTKALNDERIAIKKNILASIAPFEDQINYITEIIDGADNLLRQKVRDMEEAAREEKKDRLYEIWQLRAGSYELPQMVPDAFDLWLQPQYLNATFSITKVENEMIAWLEEKQKEIDTLHSMDDEYMVAYLSTFNIADAIQAVKDREERIEAVHAASESEQEESAIFVIKGEMNIKFTEMLLKTNNIEFTRR